MIAFLIAARPGSSARILVDCVAGRARAAGHGLAGPLVVIWGIPWAEALFPMIVLVWMMAAACWPANTARQRAATMSPV